MQGFNKYYPPDYDPSKHTSLNAYRGKHALGDRARKLDKGILITRFELPFNIWCNGCNNHIGMGVRYNAEKKKIGNYYSTPIFSFRCKCHLCVNWFTIETDPKNTQYIVTSGARKKDEDWDPEENGGFKIHDPDKEGPSDPLAALEKETQAQTLLNTVQKPRIEALQEVSEHYNSDPYTLSLRARKRFRAEKKLDKARRDADDAVKGKYALPESLTLVADDDTARAEAREAFAVGRSEQRADRDAKRRRLDAEVGPLGSIVSASGASGSQSQSRTTLPDRTNRLSVKARPSTESAAEASFSLRNRLLQNTARHSDPFLRQSSSRTKPPDAKSLGVNLKR
ncbi:DUF572-domain-containing protein [Fomitiporia mediterranea MF3/22]|uniref:DUF572-domain-containing protein n=1 Tax=Fomitiporia mediterranea (strain MF3/22) TaxID=694068 RepID=UPI0004407BBB|nr:DUF572-domain-containing protein [Fomitiporia mediterranea MF3/22]EJD06619.1 DUF572-domain-containing protein [Fomitiporia mediterranea MF3/22]